MVQFIQKHYIFSIFAILIGSFSAYKFGSKYYKVYKIKNNYLFSNVAMEKSDAIKYCEKANVGLISGAEASSLKDIVIDGDLDSDKPFQYGNYWVSTGASCQNVQSANDMKDELVNQSLKAGWSGIKTIITGKVSVTQKEEIITCLVACKKN